MAVGQSNRKKERKKKYFEAGSCCILEQAVPWLVGTAARRKEFFASSLDMIVQLRMKLKVGRQRPQHFHYIREVKDDEDIGKILSQVASGDGWRVSGPGPTSVN